MNSPMTDQEVREVIYDACKRMGVPNLADDITFSFNKRFTRRLGDANYLTMKIRLSYKLFALATPEQREDTIRHECAHLAVYHIYGEQAFLMPSHGREWKMLARLAGAVPKAVSNKIEGSESLRKGSYPHKMACKCRIWWFSNVRFRRFKSGRGAYSCPHCKSHITTHPDLVLGKVA